MNRVRSRSIRYVQDSPGAIANIGETLTPCEIWTKAVSGSATKRPVAWNKRTKKVEYVARIRYEEKHGPIGYSLEIDHLCNTPLYVNVDHLEAVTRAENMRRRGERQTHCVNGHEYTNENTMLRSNGNGRRSCKTCHRENQRRYRKG